MKQSRHYLLADWLLEASAELIQDGMAPAALTLRMQLPRYTLGLDDPPWRSSPRMRLLVRRMHPILPLLSTPALIVARSRSYISAMAPLSRDLSTLTGKAQYDALIGVLVRGSIYAAVHHRREAGPHYAA